MLARPVRAISWRIRAKGQMKGMRKAFSPHIWRKIMQMLVLEVLEVWMAPTGFTSRVTILLNAPQSSPPSDVG